VINTYLPQIQSDNHVRGSDGERNSIIAALALILAASIEESEGYEFSVVTPLSERPLKRIDGLPNNSQKRLWKLLSVRADPFVSRLIAKFQSFIELGEKPINCVDYFDTDLEHSDRFNPKQAGSAALQGLGYSVPSGQFLMDATNYEGCLHNG